MHKSHLPYDGPTAGPRVSRSYNKDTPHTKKNKTCVTAAAHNEPTHTRQLGTPRLVCLRRHHNERTHKTPRLCVLAVWLLLACPPRSQPPQKKFYQEKRQLKPTAGSVVESFIGCCGLCGCVCVCGKCRQVARRV